MEGGEEGDDVVVVSGGLDDQHFEFEDAVLGKLPVLFWMWDCGGRGGFLGWFGSAVCARLWSLGGFGDFRVLPLLPTRLPWGRHV